MSVEHRHIPRTENHGILRWITNDAALAAGTYTSTDLYKVALTETGFYCLIGVGPTVFQPLGNAGIVGVSFAANTITIATTSGNFTVDDIASTADVGSVLAALSSYIPVSDIGTTVAPLVSGQVPSMYLPSYVDDVVEYDHFIDFPGTGEAGKIYVDKEFNKQYRWTGSAYMAFAGGAAFIKNTAVPNATVPAVAFDDPYPGDANYDGVLLAKGTGAIVAAVPDNASTGGNKRGQYAVDLQRDRTSLDRVASGNNSAILGGKNNAASGEYSAVLGGLDNIASDIYAHAFGYGCAASGYGSVAGGHTSSASGYLSHAYGKQCVAGNYYSTVVGGEICYANGAYAISGGFDARANELAAVAFGYSNWATAQYSAAIGGNFNKAYATGSVVLGGRSNVSYGQYSALLGGYNNTVNGMYGLCFGGTGNTVGSYGYAIGGGSNTVIGSEAGAICGSLNSVYGHRSLVVSSLNVTVNGVVSFVFGDMGQSEHQGDYSWAFPSAGKNSNYTQQAISRSNNATNFYAAQGRTQELFFGTQTINATAIDMVARGDTGITSVSYRLCQVTGITVTKGLWKLKGTVLAHSQSGTDWAEMDVSAVVEYDGTTFSFVGGPTISKTNSAGAAAWTFGVAFTGTGIPSSESLRFIATGAAATTINWSADLKVTGLYF